MKHAIFFVNLGLIVMFSCSRNMTGPTSGPALDIISIVQLDHSLRKIAFIDEQHGWALTDSAGMYRTTDGGGNWELFPFGVDARIWDMSFVSRNVGWVCGYDTTVLHTNDGGRTWTRQVVANAADSIFQHVDFINERDGWLITSWGDVYGTTNGGTRWELLSQLQIGGLSFVKMWGQQGIVAQHSGSVLKTNNGGRSWLLVSVPDEIAGQTFFVSPDDGWIFQSAAPFS